MKNPDQQLDNEMDRKNEIMEELKKVESFETAKGSVYTYDDEGHSTRFKTATGEKLEKQNITVFFDMSPQEEQVLLKAFTDETQNVDIVENQSDGTIKIIRRIEDISNPDEINFSIIKGGKVVSAKKATLIPQNGLSVFESQDFLENGKVLAKRHLGNRVVKINYRS